MLEMSNKSRKDYAYAAKANPVLAKLRHFFEL